MTEKIYKCSKSFSDKCIKQSQNRIDFRGYLCFECYQDKMRLYHRKYYSEKRKKIVNEVCASPVIINDSSVGDNSSMECNCPDIVHIYKVSKTGKYTKGGKRIFTQHHTKMKEGHVYMLCNIDTGSYYIGSTKDPKTRENVHKSTTTKYPESKTQQFLYNILRKEGIENFKLISLHILKDCCVKELTDLENKYIRILKPPLNTVGDREHMNWMIEDDDSIIKSFYDMVERL